MNERPSLLPPSLLQLPSRVYDGKDVLERGGKTPVRGTNERALSFELCDLGPLSLGTQEEQAAERPWQLRITQGSLGNFFTSEEPFTTYEGLSQPPHGISQEPTNMNLRDTGGSQRSENEVTLLGSQS